MAFVIYVFSLFFFSDRAQETFYRYSSRKTLRPSERSGRTSQSSESGRTSQRRQLTTSSLILTHKNYAALRSTYNSSTLRWM